MTKKDMDRGYKKSGSEKRRNVGECQPDHLL